MKHKHNNPTYFDPELISKSFGLTFAKRGRAYFEAGYVTLVDSKYSAQGGLELIAFVRNQRGQSYRTHLAYQSEYSNGLYGLCSCPMVSDCKHCAALAYAWLETEQAVREPKRAQNDLDDWLSQWETLHNSPKVSARQDTILYQLDLNASQELTLSILRGRALDKGGYAKLRLAHLKTLSHDSHPQSQELEDIKRLINQIKGQYYFSALNQVEGQVLSGYAGLSCLYLLLASGHCYWQDSHNPILNNPALNLGSARQAQITWQQNPDQSQSPQLSLDPPATLRFLLADKVFYLDLEQGRLGQIEAPFGLQAIQLIASAPAIPESDLARVYLQLREALQAPEPALLPLPLGLEIKEEVIDQSPRCHLILSSYHTHQGSYQHQAELEFEYAGLYPDTNKKTAQQEWAEDGVIYHIKRDLAFEAQARQTLSETGMHFVVHNGQTQYGLESGASADLAWYRWLVAEAPKLESLGWQIHVSEDFQLQVHNSPDWVAHLSTGESQDWFQFSLGIELNGERINLLPLLVRLLQSSPNPRQLQAELATQEKWILPLDDGPSPTQSQRWLEVPGERLVTIFNTLIELYDTEPLNADGNLEFGLFTSLQFEALLNAQGLDWHGAEDLRALLEKIKDFQGIAAVPVPVGLRAELRPYQQSGLNWLQFLREYGFQGILADDMGLGKTLQTLAHLLVEKQSGRLNAPALVVAPTSVLSNWKHESQRFSPELKVLVLHGPQRKDLFAEIHHYDLVITSYALIRHDQDVHTEASYTWLILDEAQNIKNPRAKTSQILFQMETEHRLCLSGTPMENHLEELWSLYRFLMPGFLGSLERFNRLFRHPIERQGDESRQATLRERVRPFLLRRRKTEVETELPPKTEMLKFVALEHKQRDLYETIRIAMDKKVRDEIKSKGLARSQIMILDALLKLRQVCCDPHLLKLPEARKVTSSAKLNLLMQLVPELIAEGRRILIFSQFVQMLNLIETELNREGLTYSKLTGQTRKRDQAIERFQSGEVPIFLISLKAGGVGLNLTAADTVIHYDPWWNPAVENQATDRAWRIGQDKPVFVYKLIVEGSVEESILALQSRKQALTDSMYSSNAGGGLKLQAEELLSLLAP